MGFFRNVKKKIEIKQAQIDSKTHQKALEKIPNLKKALENSPDNFGLIYQLYECYVDLSNSEKKVECLEKMQVLKPNDSFVVNQLAWIYFSELNDPEKGKLYQDKANKINSNKFL